MNPFGIEVPYRNLVELETISWCFIENNQRPEELADDWYNLTPIKRDAVVSHLFPLDGETYKESDKAFEECECGLKCVHDKYQVYDFLIRFCRCSCGQLFIRSIRRFMPDFKEVGRDL